MPGDRTIDVTPPTESESSSAPDPAPRDPALVERFVQLFAANSRRLFAYIMVLVCDRDAAEEVFQEMSLVLWREFHHYREDGDFVRWANAMSLNQVRKFRRNRQRDRLVFNDNLVDEIAREAERMESELDPRRKALRACLDSLKERDRTVLDLFYGSKMSADSIAQRINRSVHTVYKSLKMLRKALMKCIKGRVAAEQEGAS